MSVEENQELGMRGFENDQPNPFDMEDSSEDLIAYEGFMSGDYAPKVEEKTEQQSDNPDTNAGKINYDDDDQPDVNNPKPEEAAGTDSEKINYDDDKAPEKTDEFKAEDAIAKLEALGFKVDKSGEPDPIQTKEFEIKEIDRVNTDLKAFVQMDDLRLCREHVVEEIITQWKKQGKTIDLNSEDFKTEVEYEMVQFEDNPRLAKLQANDVKQILNGAIERNEAKKNEIFNEVKSTRDKEIQENRQALQGVFDSYNGKVLFGQKIEPEHLKKAYRSLTSGDFTKQTESDRTLQAEFALYQLFRKDVANTGGRTYNEGVAAAVKALEGNGPKVESSLAQTVSRNGAGSVVDRVSAWRNAEKVDEPNK